MSANNLPGPSYRITLVVEWYKSRTWGMCPKVKARVYDSDSKLIASTEAKATGCGYDKESAAVAKALNYVDELRDYMFEKFADKVTCYDLEPQDREYKGASGFYTFKKKFTFEGGVGMEAYNRFFTEYGTVLGVEHGKSSDYYSYEI